MVVRAAVLANSLAACFIQRCLGYEYITLRPNKQMAPSLSLTLSLSLSLSLTHTHTHTHTHTYIHSHIKITHRHACTYMLTCTYTETQKHTHTHLHEHMHAHTITTTIITITTTTTTTNNTNISHNLTNLTDKGSLSCVFSQVSLQSCWCRLDHATVLACPVAHLFTASLPNNLPLRKWCLQTWALSTRRRCC